MKTITLNFGKWRSAGLGGKLRRIYKRYYWKEYIWTPIVFVEWIILNNQNKQS